MAGGQPPPPLPSPPPHQQTNTVVHRAFQVTHIKNYIPYHLSLDDPEYNHWRDMMIVHCGVFGVQCHLDGTAIPSGSTDDTWQQLDYLVQSWIFGTISKELLNMVPKSHTTAYQDHLREASL
ncbi:hypothetical protein RND81_07G123300 [Saponaria officinalis]|uniref:Retrotransposon Copia-like N-terminal domain-containing protein n=1 Tax=Saponaria officinalis TaxID=3572 RepID=A0AAW1JS66_SAPOF